MLQFLIVRSKGLSRVSSSGIRTAADFSPPFSQISLASSAFPIPSLLGAEPYTACKDESEVNWAQSDIEEEEELEEIALEPDFNYSTCNVLGGKFKADYPAYHRLKTDASTFGHLVPNDCGLHVGFRLESNWYESAGGCGLVVWNLNGSPQ